MPRLPWHALVLACALGLPVLAAQAQTAIGPAPRGGAIGPAPRGGDGRFLNWHDTGPRPGRRVTFPFLLRRARGAFVTRPNAPGRIENDGSYLRENARHSVPTITWVGHSTLLVQLGHASFLTDPTWSSTASPVSFAGPRRFVAPGLALDALPAIDFVLVSHNHYDHLDLETLEALSARDPRTRFIVPLGNGALLREAGIESVDELDWGERLALGAVEIHCLPAQHWSQRGLRDRRRALWSSWAVTAPDRRFYFAGDSGYFDGFAAIGKALGPFDLAALPIGAYEPQAMMRPSHLDPEQAVQAGRDLAAQRVVGIHFGTFDLSDEPLDEPPRRFRAAADVAGYPETNAFVLRIGEMREF